MSFTICRYSVFPDFIAKLGINVLKLPLYEIGNSQTYD